MSTGILRPPFFYDVTLRDGNQALKTPWDYTKKAEIFQRLCTLGVPGIEVGYPGASHADFDGVKRLAQEAPDGMVISALARANDRDIEAAVAALAETKRASRRIHTFIGTSPHHMQNVLHKSPLQVEQMAVRAVELARKGLDAQTLTRWQIQFSAEHFGDCVTNIGWVIDVFRQVIAAGATIINLPNTVERYRPSVFIAMVKEVVAAIDNQTIIAVHCHNDLGMATATTVESYFAGVQQLEVTLNGLGERAGNTNLYETAVALHCNSVATGLDLSKIYTTAIRVADLSDVSIPDKAPLIGPEVFRHRSGIHQDGALKTEAQDKGAYRPIAPELIGRLDAEQCLFTSQSGKAAAAAIIRESGRDISDADAAMLQPALKTVSETFGQLEMPELAAVYDELVRLKATKPFIAEADLMALAADVIKRCRGHHVWQLVNVEFYSHSSGSASGATVSMSLSRNGEVKSDAAKGDGPIDAAVRVISRIIGMSLQVRNFQSQAVTAGSDAQGMVGITVVCGAQEQRGEGVDTNTNVATVKAVLSGLNAILSGQRK